MCKGSQAMLAEFVYASSLFSLPLICHIATCNFAPVHIITTIKSHTIHNCYDYCNHARISQSPLTGFLRTGSPRVNRPVGETDLLPLPRREHDANQLLRHYGTSQGLCSTACPAILRYRREQRRGKPLCARKARSPEWVRSVAASSALWQERGRRPPPKVRPQIAHSRWPRSPSRSPPSRRRARRSLRPRSSSRRPTPRGRARTTSPSTGRWARRSRRSTPAARPQRRAATRRLRHPRRRRRQCAAAPQPACRRGPSRGSRATPPPRHRAVVSLSHPSSSIPRRPRVLARASTNARANRIHSNPIHAGPIHPST